jgi:hypothetical protein
VVFKPEREDYMNNIKVNTWEDMRIKYGEDRDSLTVEQERNFVEDSFDLYEAEGFTKTFNTPYEDKTNVGKEFIVLGRSEEEDCDLCCLPMWKIVLHDGTTLDVYPEEIIPSEVNKTR